MPKIAYVEKNFRSGTLELIDTANRIISQYQAQGYSLTLRQLYYQLVSRNILANKQKEYKRLGSIINDARLAGLIDWYAIEDRTRNLRGNSHWSSPKSIVDAAVRRYAINKWENQSWRPEVWIEKDALVGVIERICRRLDIDYFSCRGYTSASEMWKAAQRLRGYADADQIPIVFHLGDHDPSGIDMTRDIEERLCMLAGLPIEVRRIALTMEQIEQYSPPPNPAKLTDSRASSYILEHGRSSWELDALEPDVLSSLIEEHVLGVRDEDVWEETIKRENGHKEALREAAASLTL